MDVYEVHIHPAALDATVKADGVERRIALETAVKALLDPHPWRLCARDPSSPDRYIILCDLAGLARLQWRDIEAGALWIASHRRLDAAQQARYRDKLGALPWDNIKV
ncbi:MAG TPA: hypothetical protein VN042_11625 [Asticcacaulis sp.]|nr:hypothetical protein [Asticcacaulis sp.]